MAAKITYVDLNGDAPRVSWGGVTFVTGQPVTVDDEVLIAKARKNSFFDVQDVDDKKGSSAKKAD